MFINAECGQLGGSYTEGVILNTVVKKKPLCFSKTDERSGKLNRDELREIRQ